MKTGQSNFWSNSSAPRITPEQFNQIVATAADLAIILDLDGIVQALVVNPLNPGFGRLDHWEKRDIRDFLAGDSVDKVERQLEAFRNGEVETAHSIEVDHYDNANRELPIRYTLHRTGDQDQDQILLLGRDMRPIAELQTRLANAELALEKDYETHRELETHYRDGADLAVISDRAGVIRDASRKNMMRDTPAKVPIGVDDKSMQNVMSSVGSAPLKDIVAATTDVVEKMCIETAVKLTGNNRVAAAEMLGLSRQSLYVKLRKYGLLSRDG
jgi:DNA-binding protein Fis